MPKGTPKPPLGPQRTKVLEHRRRGLSGVAIAKVLGISHQAVYAHIKELRRVGYLPNGKSA